MFESPRLSTSLRANRFASDRFSSSGNDDVAEFSDKLERQEGRFLVANQKDEYASQVREACALFAIVGIGYLFPFSALTQPIDYWSLLFPDFNMEFPLTTLFMWTNLIMLATLVFCHGGSDPSKTSHYTGRIVGGFVGQLLVLVAVPSFYFFQWNERANVVAVLGSTAVAAFVTAFIDSSVIALVAQYPIRVQEYFQLGVGVSTLIGSIYRDVTKISFPPDAIVKSSLIYFYTGAATIGVCIVAYCRLIQLPLSKQCLAKVILAAEDEAHQPHHHQHLPYSHEPSTEGSPLLASSTKTQLTSQHYLSTGSRSVGEPDRYQVLRKIFFNECMVLLLFSSTLALWPPLVTEIPAYGLLTQRIFLQSTASSWWSLVLLTIFSICDCVGRLLVRFRMGWNKDNIWKAVVFRLVLFPLLIVGQVQGWFILSATATTTTTDGAESNIDRISDITNGLALDIWSFLLVGLLGMTNGYMGTLCIILVNDCLETSQEQAIAGTFTSFFLNSGLVLGSTFGLLFDALVTK